MKRSEKVAICLAGGLILSASTRAAVTDSQGNPYQGIVERNVFALKPAPKPEDNPPPKEPLPVIEVQGITSIFGKLQAMFSVTKPGGKPGQPGQKESKVLGVGQRDEDIEVVAIDEKARTVKFDNHGTTEIKDLAKDSPKPPSGPVPAPLPGIVRRSIPGVPLPAAQPNPVPTANASVITFNSGGPTLRNIPNRPTRGPTEPGVGMAAPVTVPTAHTKQPPPLSPEEQAAALIIDNAADPSGPPPPPIPGLTQ